MEGAQPASLSAFFLSVFMLWALNIYITRHISMRRLSAQINSFTTYCVPHKCKYFAHMQGNLELGQGLSRMFWRKWIQEGWKGLWYLLFLSWFVWAIAFMINLSKLVCVQSRSIDETDSRMNLTCICCVSSITPWVARLPICLKYFTSACKSYDPAAWNRLLKARSHISQNNLSEMQTFYLVLFSFMYYIVLHSSA